MKSLAIILIAAALSLVGMYLVLDYATMPAGAVVCSGPCSSDKYDGDCQPDDTAGRCADKCPPGTYEQGSDKETGAALCALPPTGCPYADLVPLGPQCDRLAPQVLGIQTPPLSTQTFEGK